MQWLIHDVVGVKPLLPAATLCIGLGAAMFDGTLCSTSKDNTCTGCTKPQHAKYGNDAGTISSGTCAFVCTNGYSGDQCDISNICTNSTVVLGDAHGDGWNGATAHVDAYTSDNEWTYVTYANWIDGASTHQNNANTAITANKNLGCLKNGCYSIAFTDVGSFPAEGQLEIVFLCLSSLN